MEKSAQERQPQAEACGFTPLSYSLSATERAARRQPVGRNDRPPARALESTHLVYISHCRKAESALV
jgi:hypothetical protein